MQNQPSFVVHSTQHDWRCSVTTLMMSGRCGARRPIGPRTLVIGIGSVTYGLPLPIRLFGEAHGWPPERVGRALVSVMPCGTIAAGATAGWARARNSKSISRSFPKMIKKHDMRNEIVAI